MSKIISDLLDEIQIKGNLTLDDIGKRIKRSRPYLSTEKSSKKENKKLEGLLREHFKDILQNQTLVIDNPTEYLIKKAISIEAYERTSLMALGEILAHLRGESVTKVLAELTRAVEGERGLNK